MFSPFYNEDELAALRAQLTVANDKAHEAVRRAGIVLHPRVVAIKAKLAETPDGPDYTPGGA